MPVPMMPRPKKPTVVLPVLAGAACAATPL